MGPDKKQTTIKPILTDKQKGRKELALELILDELFNNLCTDTYNKSEPIFVDTDMVDSKLLVKLLKIYDEQRFNKEVNK